MPALQRGRKIGVDQGRLSVWSRWISLILLGFELGLGGTAHAQIDTLRFYDPLILRDSSQVVVLLDEIELTPLPDFDDYNQRIAYFMLRQKVLKVYPYAAIGRDTLFSVETQQSEIQRRRARKKMAKTIEHKMRTIFEDELRKLTRSEGQILMKLIYRETGESAYDITKRIRGGWSAVFYQTLAKFYDSDMKSTYDPVQVPEDAWIENILQRAFASGTLKP